jgi:WD40 repeat protein
VTIVDPSHRASLSPVIEAPYVGLVPFAEADEAYFFGRERERDLIIANLTAARLTLLYAPSGIGKSSVLRAGVVPQSRRIAAETFEDLGMPGALTVYVSDWTGDPSETVARSLLLAITGLAGTHPVSATSQPRFDVGWLREVIASSHVSAIHLVLDQFEEFFLYHPLGGGFVEALGEVLRSRGLPVNVLVSIREDALAELDQFKAQIPNLFDNYMRLPALSRRSGRVAITGPLEQFNRAVADRERMSIEPALVELLLDEVRVGLVRVTAGEADGAPEPVSSEEIEAPYLQLVLMRLWDEERAAGSAVMRRDTLERLGGAETVVRSHLDDVIAALDTDHVDLAAAIFHHLVTTSGSKIALTAEDLAEWSGRDVNEVRQLLDTLCAGRQRILRPVPPPLGRSGPPRYEIFHDVMGEAILDWRRRHVAEAEQARAQQQLIAEREAAVAESKAARRHLRRVRLVAGAMGVALVVMAVLGVVAYQRDRTAREQRLLAEASATLADDPGLSLRRAVAAYSIDQDAEAREAVLVASSAPRSTIIDGARTPGHPDLPDVADLDVTPDGRQIVTYDVDGGVSVMTSSGLVVHHTDGPAVAGRVVDGTTSDDGLHTAAVTDRGELVVSDLESGRTHVVRHAVGRSPRLALVTASGRDYAVVMSDDMATAVYELRSARLAARLPTLAASAQPIGDGQHLVTWDVDGSLRVWDVVSGAQVAESDPLAYISSALVVAGDRVIAAWSEPSTDPNDPGRMPHIATWTWAAGRQLVQHSVPTTGEVQRMRLVDDDNIILLALDKRVVLLPFPDDSTGPLDVYSGTSQLSDWVNDAQAIDGFRWVVTAGNDGRMLMWSTYDTIHPTYELLGHDSGVLSVGVLRGGKAVVSLDVDGTVRLWTLPVVERFDEHQDWILQVSASTDGKWFLTSSRDGTARVMTAGLSLAATISPANGVGSAVFDPTDSRRVVTISEFGTAPQMWGWSRGAPNAVVAGPEFEAISGTGVLTSLAISPDGKTVAAGDQYGAIHRWDVTTGQLLDEARALTIEGPVLDLEYDHTGAHLAATGASGTTIWGLPDLRSTQLLEAKNAYFGAFDPRGEHVAVGRRSGGTIDIWTTDGRFVRSIDVHSHSTGHLRFSDDGRLLAVGTAEGLIDVIDVRTGRTIMLSRVHGDSVNDVLFKPGDPRHIISASDDTTVTESECKACVDPDGVIDDARRWVEANPSGG